MQYQETLRHVEDSIPDSSEFEALFSELISVVLSKEAPPSKRPGQEIQVNSENLAGFLTHFMCNMTLLEDKEEHEMFEAQHRIAKNVFDWNEIKDRLNECKNYQTEFSQFFKVIYNVRIFDN